MSRELQKYGTGSVWDFMSEVERTLDEVWRTPQMRKGMSGAFTPAVDVHETDDSYLLSLDVPGIPQENIKVEASDGRLSISGERSGIETEEDEGFHRVERSFGKFERSFSMPVDADQGKIQARYENGVLEIMIPKTELAKPKAIPIETEKGGLFSRMLGGKKNVPSEKDMEKH